MIATILIFIVILGILVLVHEFGHFIVAKKSGMVVHEFGFGFPPRLVGIQKVGGKWKTIIGHKDTTPDFAKASSGEPPADAATPLEKEESTAAENTIYSINLIPVGGFVRIMGENNEHEEDQRSFINKGFWPRFFTLVAGVVMNFLLAAAIYSVGFGVGLPAGFENTSEVPAHAIFKNPKVSIVEVVKDQPAYKAGLMEGDIVVSVDGKVYTQASDLREYILNNAGKTFTVVYKRGGQEKTAQIESLSNPLPGQGPTGIALGLLGTLRYPWYIAPIEGFKNASLQVVNIVTGIYEVIKSHAGLSALGGPVKIAKLTGQVAGMGFIYVMQFTAFLSLNLAVLNILPFPALDGGRVLFLIIEKIRGKKNNQKVEQFANAAGFVLLLLLMVLVTIKDIVKG